jgi:tetratricopeptide (TPR) repeat protein
MVSQHFGRVAPHDDEAEVLRGGMLLSYGMHPQATEVFERLIERQAAPAVRDRAWFFLARIRHQRGLLAQAQDALARIAAPLPARWKKSASCCWRTADGAAGLCRRRHGAGRPQGQPPTPGQFARFNLGVAWIKTGGRPNGASPCWTRWAARPAPTKQRSLRDRANVALGFVALQAKKPLEARAALQRVRLNASTQANKALLGFGWAATALNDPQLALVPFTELVAAARPTRPCWKRTLPLPYAMAEIGAYSRALEGYEQAVTVFGSERRHCKAPSPASAAAPWCRPAGAQPGRSRPGRLQPASTELPRTAACGAAGTACWPGTISSRPTRHLRDLQFVAANLARWLADLGTFGDMLANRQQAFAQKLPAVRAQSGAINLPALQQRRDTLAAE